ncbi:MAG: Ku protein [Gemmatimonadota bacterium]
MARSIWKGSLGFGLVTIGVELFSAEAPERLDLDLLDKRDMGRIGYLKINKNTGKPVPKSDIVRGFNVAGDKYVLLSDADLKAANPEATRLIDVLGFMPSGTIAPLYFAKPYFVAPLKGSEKAYSLLRETLADTEQQALAQVVIRTRQYLTTVYPHDRLLIAQTLRYDDEMKAPSDLGFSPPRKTASSTPRPAELAMARKLVEEMAIDWKPSAYHDDYRDDLLKLVKRRAKGAKTAKEAPEKVREPKVLDLMEALRRSVEKTPAARKSTSKRSRRSA